MSKSNHLTKLILIGTLFFITGFTQEKKIPNITLKSLNGGQVSTDAIENGDKPMIIALWAVWCPHCHVELTNISEVYSEWQEETGVKLIAISTDDSRTINKVEPYVNSQGWDYEVYFDPNGDLKRALGVNMLPYIAVLDSDRNIVYERFSYSEGDEEDLYDVVKEL